MGSRWRGLWHTAPILYTPPMARLRRDADGTEVPLFHDALAGRAEDAVVPLGSQWASTRHASFQWSGKGWSLRDLGSRNGTMVGGSRVPAGGAVLLIRGMHVAFGAPEEAWTLVDDRPPQAAATSLVDGAAEEQVDGRIHLPSPEDAQLIVYEHPSLGWMLERADGSLDRAEHGQLLTASGGVWRLHLVQSAQTTERAAPGPDPEDCTLRLTVSADEEHVDAELLVGEEVLSLKDSVHWYIVLQLARARLADAGGGELPDKEHGWVYRDEFCEQLRLSRTKLNVDLHRLRQILAKVGVDELIERRSSSGQLRLAFERVEIC